MEKQITTRDQIVETADRLFYHRGFEHTSFADVAAEVKISRGNFYHHFKSKDDILEAVIGLRITRTKAMLETWRAESETPKERIEKFVQMLIANQNKLKLYGCPVGTLCSELAKLNHLSKPKADELMSIFRDWLRDRFIELGRKKDADRLALHLLTRSQGIAMIANTFQEDSFIQQEVRNLKTWLNSECDKKV